MQESEEEEEDEDDDEEGDHTGLQTPLVDAGLATPSGMSSVAGGLGLETPELIELRKRKIEADMEGGETPSLFTILPEKHNERIGGSMMGSAHTDDIPHPPPLPAAGRGGRRVGTPGASSRALWASGPRSPPTHPRAVASAEAGRTRGNTDCPHTPMKAATHRPR